MGMAVQGEEERTSRREKDRKRERERKERGRWRETDERRNEHTGRRTSVQKDGGSDIWMNGRTDAHMDGQTV